MNREKKIKDANFDLESYDKEFNENWSSIWAKKHIYDQEYQSSPILNQECYEGKPLKRQPILENFNPPTHSSPPHASNMIRRNQVRYPKRNWERDIKVYFYNSQEDPPCYINSNKNNTQNQDGCQDSSHQRDDLGCQVEPSFNLTLTPHDETIYAAITAMKRESQDYLKNSHGNIAERHTVKKISEYIEELEKFHETNKERASDEENMEEYYKEEPVEEPTRMATETLVEESRETQTPKTLPPIEELTACEIIGLRFLIDNQIICIASGETKLKLKLEDEDVESNEFNEAHNSKWKPSSNDDRENKALPMKRRIG